VDAILRGRALAPEVRYLDEQGRVQIEKAPDTGRGGHFAENGHERRRRREWQDERYPALNGEPERDWQRVGGMQLDAPAPTETGEGATRKPLRVFPYGIGQNRLRAAASSLNLPVTIVDNLAGADVVMTLKNYYRQQPQPLMDAERRNIPIYILRSNTVTQMEQCLANIYQLPTEPLDVFTEAMRETQEGIQRVLNGAPDAELNPRSAAIRSQQHQLARAANLVSHSYGREPYRRVRIFRP
jgi:hypothetical protein